MELNLAQTNRYYNKHHGREVVQMKMCVLAMSMWNEALDPPPTKKERALII